MTTRNKQIDRHVGRVLETLREKYLPDHPRAQIDARRYNTACIWVRILDPDYAGTELNQRWERLWELFEPLPEAIQSEISLLFLLTPKEASSRFAHMNREFENPTPTPGSVGWNGEVRGHKQRSATAPKTTARKERRSAPRSGN